MTFCSFVSYSSFNHIVKCIDSTANRAILSLRFQYFWRALYNSLHVLIISDHSHTAVTELFCKVKQPLLSYFKLNLLTRDPGDDKVQLELLTERDQKTIQLFM